MAKVVEALRVDGLVGRTSIQCFDWGVLTRVHEAEPALERNLLVSPKYLRSTADAPSPWFDGLAVDSDFVRTAAAEGFTAISPIHGSPFRSGVTDPAYTPFATGAMLDDAHRAGLAVIPYVVDDEPTMRHLVRLGVDGLITNLPERLRGVLAAEGLPLPPGVSGRGSNPGPLDGVSLTCTPSRAPPCWPRPPLPSRSRSPPPSPRRRRPVRLRPRPRRPPPGRSSTSPTSSRARRRPSRGASAALVGRSSTGPVARRLRWPTRSTSSRRWARATSCRPSATGRRSPGGSPPTAVPGRREWRAGYGLAVSPLGKVVAFAGRAGKVWTIDQEGDRVFRFNPVPVTGTAHAVTVAGENCKEGEGDPGFGCSIVVNGPRRSFYTSSHGIVDRVPHVRLASTGRGRWLGGITLADRLRLVQRDDAQLEGPVGHLRQPALRHLPGRPPRPRHTGVRRRLRPDGPRRPRHCGRLRGPHVHRDPRRQLGDVLRRGLGGRRARARRDLPGRRVGGRAPRRRRLDGVRRRPAHADRWTPGRRSSCRTADAPPRSRPQGNHRCTMSVRAGRLDPCIDRSRDHSPDVSRSGSSSPPSWSSPGSWPASPPSSPTCRTTRPRPGCRDRPSRPRCSRSSPSPSTPTTSPPSWSTTATAGSPTTTWRRWRPTDRRSPRSTGSPTRAC